MHRLVIALATLAGASCAYPNAGELADEVAPMQDVELTVGRGQDRLPPPVITERELVAPEEALGGEALQEAPDVDAAAVEELMREALEELPELAADVRSLRVQETDAGLAVGGVVTSQEAFDDVVDLAEAAAPGVFVENDLVVVVELPAG